MNNQSSNHLFMIEPEVFYSNEQTADSNHYQKDHDLFDSDLNQQFAHLNKKLLAQS